MKKTMLFVFLIFSIIFSGCKDEKVRVFKKGQVVTVPEYIHFPQSIVDHDRFYEFIESHRVRVFLDESRTDFAYCEDKCSLYPGGKLKVAGESSNGEDYFVEYSADSIKYDYNEVECTVADEAFVELFRCSTKRFVRLGFDPFHYPETYRSGELFIRDNGYNNGNSKIAYNMCKPGYPYLISKKELSDMVDWGEELVMREKKEREEERVAADTAYREKKRILNEWKLAKKQ